MSTRRASLSENRWPANHGFPAGWYPDPDNASSLRFWDGEVWTDHRAALLSAAATPAVCACGVVATGSCRVCSKPFCRAHISDEARDDRAFRVHWQAWTCNNCVVEGQRYLRDRQLERCESVTPQLLTMGKMRRIRTTTGLKPRKVNVFERASVADERPVRRARPYLVMYDGASEDSTFQGLAISGDGSTVFDVGVPAGGVRSGRIGPKKTVAGYMLRAEITIDALREAAAKPTTANWFEYAARAYLAAANRLRLQPLPTTPPVEQTERVIEADVANESIADTDNVAVLEPPTIDIIEASAGAD